MQLFRIAATFTPRYIYEPQYVISRIFLRTLLEGQLAHSKGQGTV
jgi:hypothetical protein